MSQSPFEKPLGLLSIINAKRLSQKRILLSECVNRPSPCSWHFPADALEFRRRGSAFRLSSSADPLFATLRRLLPCQSSAPLARATQPTTGIIRTRGPTSLVISYNILPPRLFRSDNRLSSNSLWRGGPLQDRVESLSAHRSTPKGVGGVPFSVRAPSTKRERGG